MIDRDEIGGTAAGRNRDAANVRAWDPKHPTYVGTRNALGVHYMQTGRADAAFAQFSAAVRVQPDHAVANYNLKDSGTSQAALRKALGYNESRKLAS